MKQLFLVIFFSALLVTSTVEAATLYIDPAAAKLYRGDAITVAVRLDVDEISGECVNAVDGIIHFDDAITAVDVSVGKSIFPVWVESPVINQAEHTITFAGGIPNGYCGRVQGDPNLTNTLVELVFRSPGQPQNPQIQSAAVTFDPATTAYLNDGNGTKATLRTFGTTIALSAALGTQVTDAWSGAVADDKQAPEDFSISLERDETTFGGKYYVVFNTTDKQTGLSHYEIIEESLADSKLFRWGAATTPWREIRSPYVLKDQSLKRVIRVKAIDKAGNEYIATLIPDKSLQSFSLYDLIHTLVVVLVVALLGLCCLFALTTFNRVRHRKILSQQIKK